MAVAVVVAAAKRAPRVLCHLRGVHHPSYHTETPLQLSIRTAIEANNHRQIPHILLSSSTATTSPDAGDNPFSFLSRLPPALAARLVDALLHSFLLLRPRSLPHPAYAALLLLFLPATRAGLRGYPSAHLPLAFAVLQSSVRCGYSPPPPTRRALALCWVYLRRRHHRKPPSRLLASMRAVGYRLDARTCNHLICALCTASEAEEAIGVLRGMGAAGCPPDAESYCTVIDACCGRGGSGSAGVGVAAELMWEMVAGEGMAPRKGTVGMWVAAMRREGRGREAAEVVRLLGREGCAVGFEEYESAVEGCLEGGALVMAGKVVVEMSRRGFIPYIKARQRVVEGLAGIGQLELASAVRQSLSEVGS